MCEEIESLLCKNIANLIEGTIQYDPDLSGETLQEEKENCGV